MVHGLKAITPVISVILLLLLTITIVGFAMIFMQRSVQTTSEESEQQLAKQTSSLGENFEVINVNGNQVTVRNKGTAELKNLAFYVDNNPVKATGAPIPKDGIGTFTLNAAQIAQYPGKKLKVSSSGLAKEQDAGFYSSSTVAYYTFDGTDGRTIRDESGNGNDGIFKGEETKWNDGMLADANPGNADGGTPPKVVAGKYGYALSFDGTDDYVTPGNVASLLNVNTFTWSIWLKANDLSVTRFPMGKRHFKHFRLNTDGSLWFEVMTDSTSKYSKSVAGIITTNQWMMLTATYDTAGDRKIRLYKNGIEVSYADQPALTGTENSETAEDGWLTIGAYSTTELQFPGLIDEVRIYNRALAQGEIQEDMDSTYPINRPVASWSFESVSGNQVMDTHNVVAGRYGSAISFDGVDDYVYATDAGTGSAMDVDYITAEAWIKPSALTASGNTIINKRFMGGAPRTWEMFIDVNGRLSWLISRDNTEWKETSSAGGAIVSGDWHHIIGTYDGSYGRLHINGVAMEPPVNVVGKLGKNNDETRIGKNYNGQYFNGVIDEVRILDKAIG